MRHLSWPVLAGMILFVITGSWTSPALAQDGKGPGEVQKDIEKELDATHKALLEKISKIVSRDQERIAKLESALKERDGEIVSLKKKVEELAAQKPKTEEKPKAAEAPKAGGQPLLGVAHEEPADDARAKLNLKAGQGAQVTSVHPNSPAAKAGLEPGDIIVSFGGKDVGSESLREEIKGHKPGEKVDLVFLRGAEKITKQVELADRDKLLASTPSEPAAKPAQPAAPPAPPKPEPVVLGLLIEETDAGLTVQNVEQGKTGAAAELKEGDIILSINGKKVKKLEEVPEARDKSKVGEQITIDYRRKDEVFHSTVIAAGEKGQPKLVKVDKETAPKPAETPQKSPGLLGIQVFEGADGVKVIEVKPGGAAAAAGLKENDILVEVAQKAIHTIDDLKTVLKSHSAGETIALVVTRAGEKKSIENFKLGGGSEPVAKAPEAKPAPEKAAGEKAAPKPEEAKPPPPAQKPRGVLGITAQETDDQRIIVSVVNAKGPGEKAGLKKDDLIVKVNGVEIKSFDALEKVLKSLFAGDTVRMVVKRGEETKELELQLGSPETAGEP